MARLQVAFASGRGTLQPSPKAAANLGIVNIALFCRNTISFRLKAATFTGLLQLSRSAQVTFQRHLLAVVASARTVAADVAVAAHGRIRSSYEQLLLRGSNDIQGGGIAPPELVRV